MIHLERVRVFGKTGAFDHGQDGLEDLDESLVRRVHRRVGLDETQGRSDEIRFDLFRLVSKSRGEIDRLFRRSLGGWGQLEIHLGSFGVRERNILRVLASRQENEEGRSDKVDRLGHESLGQGFKLRISR